MTTHLDPSTALTPTRQEQRASDQARRGATARNQSGRRRFVDPATCERQYSGPEMEFLNAIQEYKRASGRMFPTWSEVLEVVHALGYVKAQA
jgi:outer membrane protein TolC